MSTIGGGNFESGSTNRSLDSERVPVPKPEKPTNKSPGDDRGVSYILPIKSNFNDGEYLRKEAQINLAKAKLALASKTPAEIIEEKRSVDEGGALRQNSAIALERTIQSLEADIARGAEFWDRKAREKVQRKSAPQKKNIISAETFMETAEIDESTYAVRTKLDLSQLDRTQPNTPPPTVLQRARIFLKNIFTRKK